MAVTLDQIRSAIKTTIENSTTGVHVYKYVPASMNPKAVVVIPRRMNSVTMDRGVCTYNLSLVLVSSTADNTDGQRVLDEMLQTEGSQIIAAIDGTKTLGLSDTRAHIGGWDDYGQSEFAGVDYWTVAMLLEVHTKGN